MPKIFISYRREDSKAYVERIHDRLVTAFGKSNVFQDVDKGILPGTNWQDALQAKLDECDFLLVIIGEKWEKIINQRARSSNDWVRFEIERGLLRKKIIIPILVEDTNFPRQLPRSIQALAGYQSFRVRSNPDFNMHMDRLVELLETHPLLSTSLVFSPDDETVRIAPLQPIETVTETKPETFSRRMTLIAIGVVIVILILLSSFIFLPRFFDTDGTIVAVNPTSTATNTPTATNTTPPPTETNTLPPPTPTRDFDGTATANQNIRATANAVSTQIAQTEQADLATARFQTAQAALTTENAAITQTFVARPTYTPTSEPTVTETPTTEPSPTVDVYAAAVQVAKSFTGTVNGNWQPIIHDFGDGVEMVLVPVGCFDMGSDSGAFDMDGGVGYGGHICFNQPFWIDRTEVTQADFRNLGGTKIYPNNFTGDNRPVEQILWSEARDFCEQQRGIRLPTEAEWEYAARGVESFLYPWGNTFISNNIVYGPNSGGQTQEVGSRPNNASWVGAFDMLGNVEEYTSSLFYGYPYPTDENGFVIDDGRESRDSLGNRVKKGGAFFSYISTLVHSASRVYCPNGAIRMTAGFRCTRSAN